MKLILPLLLIGTTIDLPYDTEREIVVKKIDTIHFVEHEEEEAEYINLLSYYKDDHPSYEEIKVEAISSCRYRKPHLVDEGVIDELISIEKSFDVPPTLRGMLLAAACLKSGYSATAKGDRKFSKSGKKPMALGILQMWKWWERAYDIDRTNVNQAATAWMTHIKKLLPKVKRQCKKTSDRSLWIAAWVTGIRAPKDGGRCNERPTHYRLLKKWHREIKNNREEVIEHIEAHEDGC